MVGRLAPDGRETHRRGSTVRVLLVGFLDDLFGLTRHAFDDAFGGPFGTEVDITHDIRLSARGGMAASANRQFPLSMRFKH